MEALQLTTDHAGKVRIIAEAAPLEGVLEKLIERVADFDPRLQLALARKLAEHGTQRLTEKQPAQAQADAAQRHFGALAEAESIRDAARARATQLVRRAEGEKGAFLAKAAAHQAQPSLTEFRLLWDTLAASLPGRPKLILDPRAGGRRHVWLADPELAGPALKRAWVGSPLSTETRTPEPDD